MHPDAHSKEHTQCHLFGLKMIKKSVSLVHRKIVLYMCFNTHVYT